MAFELMGVFVRVPVVLVDPLLLKDFRFFFVGSRISGTGAQHRNPVHAAIQVKVRQAPLDSNLFGRFGIILGIATIRNDDSDFCLRVVLRQVIKRHIECAIEGGRVHVVDVSDGNSVVRIVDSVIDGNDVRIRKVRPVHDAVFRLGEAVGVVIADGGSASRDVSHVAACPVANQVGVHGKLSGIPPFLDGGLGIESFEIACAKAVTDNIPDNAIQTLATAAFYRCFAGTARYIEFTGAAFDRLVGTAGFNKRT